MKRDWLAIVTLGGIALIAVMRCVIMFVPQRYFDVDPAFDPLPIAGMGMDGSLLLDAVLLALCALGLITMAQRGPVQWRLVVLALLPLPVIAYHGISDAGDLWRGMTWLGAALAAVVVAHLARERGMRIVLAGLLLAVIGPLLVRGATQITYEHATTVAAYQQHREQLFQDRGWEPDSPAAQIYERRLRQPQPLGWFLTTNIYGSAMLVAAVVLGGLVLATHRAKLTSGWVGLTALLAAVCIAMVYLTGSRGAMLALCAGLGIGLLPWASQRVHAITARWGPWVIVGVVFLAIAGVVVRGVILPEGFLNEKSLLFRWHYLVSAAQMIAHHPWLGVGPDGFQAAHMLYRPARNPEEVISAHAMFVDWLATLGVVGIAWVVLVLLLLGRAGSTFRSTPQPQMSDDDRQAIQVIGVRMAMAIGMVAVAVGIGAEAHSLDSLGFFVRAACVVAYVTLAAMLIWTFSRINERYLHWSLAAATAALAVHSQIEMTFFLHGAVVWAMCMVGLAASCAGDGQQPNARTRRRWLKYVPSGIAGVAAVGVLWASILVMKQQRLVRAAVDVLHPVAMTAEGQVNQRAASAVLLEKAYEIWQADAGLLKAAVRQYELAAATANVPATGQTAVQQAIEVADQLVQDHPSHDAFAMRAALHAAWARMHEDDDAWERALADARTAVQLNPHGNLSWVMLGNYLHVAGRHDEAAQAYERALEVDDNLELDPLKQLPPRRREAILRRLEELCGYSDTP